MREHFDYSDDDAVQYDEPIFTFPDDDPGDTEYDSPLFIFDDDQPEQPPVSESREQAHHDAPAAFASSSDESSDDSSGGRMGFSFNKVKPAPKDRSQAKSHTAPEPEEPAEQEFIFMPFLDIKDEPEEEEEKLSISFSKVKAGKKEKEFVFMPFLNIADETPEEDSADAHKRFKSSKGTIIDEGLVLLPLEDEEEQKKEEEEERRQEEAKELDIVDTGISIVGGDEEIVPFTPKPSSPKKSTKQKNKKPSGSKKNPLGGKMSPDDQFRAAMRSIDPEILAAVRRDPIQRAALEQAVRIALVQQAAQEAVEKATGRPVFGGFSSAPQQSQKRPGKKKPNGKSRPTGERFGGVGGVNVRSSGVGVLDLSPAEFGTPTDGDPTKPVSPTPAPKTAEPSIEFGAVGSVSDMSGVKSSPISAFTPSPNAQQDPAFAAISQSHPEYGMPDVAQDPALAALSKTSGDMRPRPEHNEPTAENVAPIKPKQPSVSSSPAAIRAAMRSGADFTSTQTAARAISSQAQPREQDTDVAKRSGCLVWIIILFITFFIGLIAIAVWPSLSKEFTYEKAVSAMNDGDYISAVSMFSDLGEYKDSRTKTDEAAYMYADRLETAGNYADALENFLSIDPTYSDTSERIAVCRYNLGKEYLAAGQFADAYDQLYLIPKYLDAGELAKEANYKTAEKLLAEENYEKALVRYQMFPDYLDSQNKWQLSQYSYAGQLFEKERYDKAYELYKELGSYNDSAYRSAVSQYDAIATGSGFTVEEMQSALAAFAANTNYAEAQTILEGHVYDKIRLQGSWALGDSYLRFEFTETGNKLTLYVDNENTGIPENSDVIFDGASVITADRSQVIITIVSFTPETAANPTSVTFRVGENGQEYTFDRS